MRVRQVRRAGVGSVLCRACRAAANSRARCRRRLASPAERCRDLQTCTAHRLRCTSSPTSRCSSLSVLAPTAATLVPAVARLVVAGAPVCLLPWWRRRVGLAVGSALERRHGAAFIGGQTRLALRVAVPAALLQRGPGMASMPSVLGPKRPSAGLQGRGAGGGQAGQDKQGQGGNVHMC